MMRNEIAKIIWDEASKNCSTAVAFSEAAGRIAAAFDKEREDDIDLGEAIGAWSEEDDCYTVAPVKFMEPFQFEKIHKKRGQLIFRESKGEKQ